MTCEDENTVRINSDKETKYINSVPGLAELILEESNKPDSDFLTEEEVDW